VKQRLHAQNVKKHCLTVNARKKTLARLIRAIHARRKNQTADATMKSAVMNLLNPLAQFAPEQANLTEKI